MQDHSPKHVEQKVRFPDAFVICPGVRYLHESFFCKALHMDKREFRSLCKRLGVPIVYRGSARYVLHSAFIEAMYSIGRVGSPDFIMPEPKGSRRGKIPKCATIKLDTERFAKDMPDILCELVYLSRKYDKATVSQLKTELQASWAELQLHLMQNVLHPLDLKSLNTEKAREHCLKEEGLPDVRTRLATPADFINPDNQHQTTG